MHFGCYLLHSFRRPTLLSSMNRTGHEMQLDASSKTAEEGPAFLLRGERSNQSRRVLVQYLTEQCQDSLRQEEGDLYDGIIPAASIKYLLSSNLSTFASNPSRAPSAPLLERSHQYEVTAPITFNPPVRTNVSPSPPSTPRFAQQNLSSQGSRGTICDEESDPFSFFPLPEVRLEPASASTLVKESFETIYSVSASPSVEASSNRTLLTSPPPALLHQVCKSHAQTETAVRRVLQLDPESVTRRLPRSRSHFLRRRKKVNSTIRSILQSGTMHRLMCWRYSQMQERRYCQRAMAQSGVVHYQLPSIKD